MLKIERQISRLNELQLIFPVFLFCVLVFYSNQIVDLV